jgi:GNAT superfamily N-acetyltransferase
MSGTIYVTAKRFRVPAVRFTLADKHNREMARAYLYLLSNDLHREPYGYVEDVFVELPYRQRGLAKKLLLRLIAEAKRLKCYKLVTGSRYTRPWVHRLYLSLGFQDHGKEFRMDL